MKPAVILDRDGTINEDVGFIWTPDKLRLIPGAVDALKLLQERYELFIVTNQSGIGQKLFTEKDFENFNRYFLNLLKDYGIKIKDVYYCPHTDEQNCLCHKPSPYFLRIIQNKYNIDLIKSWVIGDHPHDIEMASRVGAHSAYVLTGHGKKHRKELKTVPDFIAKDIYIAAGRICSEG